MGQWKLENLVNPNSITYESDHQFWGIKCLDFDMNNPDFALIHWGY